MRPTVSRSLAAISLLAAALPATAASRPRYGGVLNVRTAAAFDSLDPAGPDGFADMRPAGLIFETLLALDPQGRPQPALALSWVSDPGKRRWQFHLARGVTCHDGAELTPEAVARSLAAANGSWQVKADGDSVSIQSAQPLPELIETLASPRNAIALRRAGGAPFGTGPFRVARWEPGRSLTLEAHEAYREGRPFLDGVTILMGRGSKERLMDLELDRAEIVELRPDEVRRATQRGAGIWSSAPLVLTALVFDARRPAAGDPRLREALALSIDRPAIHGVLLQKQGEPAGGLLPRWMTGYAFLFQPARDAGRARQLASALAAPLRQITLACDTADPLARSIAGRVALNAREAGLTVRVVALSAAADLRLVEVRLAPDSAATALAGIAAALGLPVPGPKPGDSLETLYAAEASVVRDFRVIPLCHVPELYAVSPRVKSRSGPGVLASGAWRFEDLWLEAPKP